MQPDPLAGSGDENRGLMHEYPLPEGGRPQARAVANGVAATPDQPAASGCKSQPLVLAIEEGADALGVLFPGELDFIGGSAAVQFAYPVGVDFQRRIVRQGQAQMEMLGGLRCLPASTSRPWGESS